MASSNQVVDTTSDQNCKSPCNLEMGSSSLFQQIVAQQQNTKAAKGDPYLYTFSYSNEEAFYQEMLDDDMLKTFDGPEEQEIFRKALEGMNRNYPEILNKGKKDMFYCPTAFNFDSRIKPMETSVPEELEKTKATLESKTNLTPKEKKDLSIIQKHLEKLKPQLSEQEFFDALACFFNRYRGIFIHSLKFDQHLKALTEKARIYRRQNRNIGFGFTSLERKLVAQFNISEQCLNDSAEEIVDELRYNGKAITSTKIKGRVIQEVVEAKLKNNEKMYVKKQFKAGVEYSVDDVKNGVKLGLFQFGCRIPGENDLLIMLPDSKLLLSIEIKRHMKKDETSNKKIEDVNTLNQGRSVPKEFLPNVDANLQSAATQLKKNAKFISQMHGSILSPGWRFVKVAAISPTVYNADKLCTHCHKFILTTDMLKSPGGMANFWQRTGLFTAAQNLNQTTKDQSYHEFQLFFNRLVNLRSVKVITDPFRTWAQIQGNNPRHISAGHTKTNGASKEIGIEEVLKNPHDAYKVLYFNKDQQALLTTDLFLSVLFFCDFGSGRKYMCIRSLFMLSFSSHEDNDLSS